MKSLLVAATILAIAASSVDAKNKDVAYTPGGPRPKSCVHQIPSGTHVHRRVDGTDHLTYPDGSTEVKVACHEFGKKFSHPQQQSQKRRHAKEQKVNFDDAAKFDGVMGYSGWTTYTKWLYPEGVGKFLGYWNVPKNPTNTQGYPAPLYTFTALQNIDWVPQGSGNSSAVPKTFPKHKFDIIQPVMGYTGGEFGFPGQWQLSSWIVALGGGNTYHTEMINTQTGDEIFGNMTKIGEESWFINTVRKDGQAVPLTLNYQNDPLSRLSNQSWAYTAIECYYCTGCDTYPSDTLSYTKMELWNMQGQKIEAAWEDKVEKDIHWCNEGVNHTGSKDVTYHFQHDGSN